MHFFLLGGSHRPDSQSTKVAEWIQFALAQLFPESTSYLFNLKENPLPLRNDRMRNDANPEKQRFMKDRKPVQQELKKADALVIVCPERSGMATPGVKNFFLYCSPYEVGNKPALLVSVSASRGGRYPIAELRMSSYKNTQLVYIPQHVIIDHVQERLNTHSLEADEKADAYIRARLQYSLTLLHEYGRALQSVRASGVADYQTYPYGM